MTPGIHKLTTPLLCLVLLGVLSGCMLVEVLPGLYIVPTYQPDPEPWRTGKNYYEPVILTSNEDMIRIKYLSVGPNAEHKQVKQLMIDHCHGAYIETSRVELRGYDTVEAECTHDTVLLR
jgi:hypothetical protein